MLPDADQKGNPNFGTKSCDEVGFAGSLGGLGGSGVYCEESLAKLAHKKPA